MNPTGLMEMAQIAEQEHMREALRRRAAREARREAGITWIQAVRMRLFSRRTLRRPAPVRPAHPAPPVRAATLRVVRVADPECVGADC